MAGRHDFDLASGGFRLDLRTLVLLLAFIGAWYDQRSLAERRDAISEIRAEQVSKTLSDMQGLQKLQQYDIGAIKLALAEAGIRIKKGD